LTQELVVDIQLVLSSNSVKIAHKYIIT